MKFSAQAQETITIGESKDLSTMYLPLTDFSKQSVTQQIYKSDEINKESGLITEIAFHVAQKSGSERNVVIYMSETTKTNYTDAYDWIAVEDANIVYNGKISTNVDGEWLTIQLQNAFEYNGENIVVFGKYGYDG